MDGILIIDKPQGFTSFDVVAKMRGILKTRKIGHAGTLDPMATGVLPVLVGKATKCIDLMPNQSKEYIATFQLGITTDTLDSTGNILNERVVSVGQAEVEYSLQNFRGDIMQMPPMYSAIQINGKRLYDLARKGIEVEREPRPICISKLELINSDIISNKYTIKVACSKGTYIRSLCADIGESLGCGATMIDLRRIESTGFSIDQSITLVKLQQFADEGVLNDKFLSIEHVFTDLPSLHLLEGVQETRYCNGVHIELTPEQLPYDLSGNLSIYSALDEFIGIGRINPETNLLYSVKFFR